MIETVTGQLDPTTVTGRVLPHEHLVIDLRTEKDREGYLTGVQVSPELDTVRREQDLGLVVELTCRGMGRDVAALRELSRRSGVAIVAATGYYYQAFHPAGELDQPVEAVAARLVSELTESIGHTGIRAGVLGEIGTHGLHPTPAEEISLRAAAIAAATTGAPMATHAQLGVGGLGQLELLLGLGVNPARLSIGHQDLFGDTAQHRAIASEGAYVAFDTVGKSSYASDGDRLDALLSLMDAGYSSQILLSNDISRHGYLATSGGQGYRHVLTEFAQGLRQRGVDEDTLDLLYRRNPLRWLSGQEV